MSKAWLLLALDGGRQHLVFLPEAMRHNLTRRCACRPYLRNGIVVHAIISAVYVDPQMKREH